MAKKTNETVKTVEELRSELCEKVSEINKLVSDDKPASEVEKAYADAKAVLQQLNKQLGKKELARLRSTENPLLEAVKSYTYSIQKITKSTNADTGAVSYSIDTGTKQINLRELKDFCDKLVGREDFWTYRIYDFARVMAAKDAADLGLDWQKLANTFKLKKNVERSQIKNPTSMNSKVELLQSIIDMMYFTPFVNKEGKVDETKNAIKITSHDVSYISKATGGKGKAKLSVKTAQGHNDSMIMLVHDVLHHHVTGAEYSIEFKTAE